MSNVNILPGGRVNQDNAYVSADQETIVGDGTAGNPLRSAAGSGSTFVADVDSESIGEQEVIKGTALMVGGRATVRPLEVDSGARCMGLLTQTTHVGEEGRVQNTGPFTMTVAEWNAVVHGGAPTGLTPEGVYYASATQNGKIGIFAFSPGDVAIQIGTALDETTLILQIAPPVTTP